jgi:Uma2 family endonuclease
MEATAERKEWTDEELMALPQDGKKYELLGGNLVMSPTGFQHGYIASRLVAALLDHALKHRVGIVVDSSTGFRMRNGDCLSPDVSFVRKERLRGRKPIPSRFFAGAPDLAVEVRSPKESLPLMKAKLAQYFANGTRLAWVVEPRTRTVSVYHSAGRCKILRSGERLDGEGILPGFTLPIVDLFAMPDFKS